MINLLLILGALTWLVLPYISKRLSYFLVFVLLFSQGLFELSGSSGAYPKTASEVLIVSLFIRQVLSRLRGSGKIDFTGFIYFSGFLLVTFVSALINAVSLLEIGLFIKTMVVYYLLFIALLNERFNRKDIERFFNMFIVLFAIQLIAAGIKFYLIGMSEKGGIGTLSVASGSLSTLLPLFACAYLIGQYIYTKNLKYLVFVGMFALFGLIGHKRAIVFYIPIIFILIQFIYSLRNASAFKLLKQKSFVLNISKFVLLSIVIVYGLVRAHPTLNPDEKFGGRFDFDFLMDFSTQYVTQNSAENAYVLGRTEAPALVVRTVSGYGISHIFFGMGPGDILESTFLPNNEERLLYKYGIGYGGRTGLIYVFMQVGIIGTLLFFMIPIAIYSRINDVFRRSNLYYTQALALGCLGSIGVYFIDLITYSSIMINAGGLVSVFFAMPALIVQYYELTEQN